MSGWAGQPASSGIWPGIPPPPSGLRGPGTSLTPAPGTHLSQILLESDPELPGHSLVLLLGNPGGCGPRTCTHCSSRARHLPDTVPCSAAPAPSSPPETRRGPAMPGQQREAEEGHRGVQQQAPLCAEGVPMLLPARGTEHSGRVHTRPLTVVCPMGSEDRRGTPNSRKCGL